MERKPLWNPYVAGVALGLVLLLTFLLMGFGLGASGSAARLGYGALYVAAPGLAAKSDYISHYVHPGVNPLDNWLVYLTVGVFLGGIIGSMTGGRNDFGTLMGANSDYSKRKRLLMALVGGVLMGIAARFARGCTSGQALSGGALLSVGSWAFMMMVFVGGYAVAPLVRRQWK
ncbi:MAG TPA: hypothetical protein ENK02_06450 [Planctomycetes bacterium]|nr:hypothetical protein [Planctomycetota bacterium]